MKRYLIQSSEVKRGILYLRLSPATDNDRLFFISGQYVSLGFVGLNKRPSPMRSFSIVSTPNQSELEFAIRIEGEYTTTLSKLPLGAVLSLLGPFGNFTLNTKSNLKVLMIAGGIGITPFISMIRSATEEQSQKKITLLFSCRSQDDIPYLDELMRLSQINRNLRVGCFISSGPVEKLTGTNVAQGRIDEKWLRQVTGGQFFAYSFYLCGPQGLMTTLTAILRENGVEEEQIFSESFSQASKVRLTERYTAQSLIFKMAFWSLIATFLIVTIFDLRQNLPKLEATLTNSQPSTQTDTTGSNSSANTNNQNKNQSNTSTNDQNSQAYPSYSSPSYNTQPAPTSNYRTPRSAVS